MAIEDKNADSWAREMTPSLIKLDSVKFSVTWLLPSLHVYFILLSFFTYFIFSDHVAKEMATVGF